MLGGERSLFCGFLRLAGRSIFNFSQVNTFSYLSLIIVLHIHLINS
jgi:hypothetical protein